MRFRKKPVVIEAIQWKGDNQQEVRSLFGSFSKYHFVSRNNSFNIDTLEGRHRADKGDWIIKGIKGEFYPCKSDIFEATYEKVE